MVTIFEKAEIGTLYKKKSTQFGQNTVSNFDIVTK